MAFVAKWDFNCAACKERHGKGTEARFNRANEIEAVACDAAIRADAKYEEYLDFLAERDRNNGLALTVCNSCYLVHSPGQEGCW